MTAEWLTALSLNLAGRKNPAAGTSMELGEPPEPKLRKLRFVTHSSIDYYLLSLVGTRNQKWQKAGQRQVGKGVFKWFRKHQGGEHLLTGYLL